MYSNGSANTGAIYRDRSHRDAKRRNAVRGGRGRRRTRAENRHALRTRNHHESGARPGKVAAEDNEPLDTPLRRYEVVAGKIGAMR